MRIKGICALIFASALSTILPGLPAAGATAKPDLTVAAVSVKQAEAAVGEPLRISVKVRNAGNRGAAASKAAFHLSTDKRLSKGDTLLATRAGTPKLGRGETAVAVVKSAVPAGVAVGSYRLLACADATKAVRESNEANNCRATTATLKVVIRSSEDKIDQAEAAGKIDAETALRYRLFALFDDPRLPRAYRGNDSAVLESEVLETAMGSWGTLSAETREVVAPYLAPPFYEGSAWSPAGEGERRSTRVSAEADSPGCDLLSISQDWGYVDSADGTVRVWHQKRYEDNLKAVRIVDTIEKQIWPALKSLMGRVPLPDSGSGCDGGSSAVDLALVDADTDTAVRKAWLSCQSPTHILLNRNRPGQLPFVAHELMHALQYSYEVAGSCDEYQWLREATAQWFMDYVSDPSYGYGVTPDDSEWLHGAPELYLDRPEVALESTSPKHHEYGSYLWFFFMARFDTPNYVRAVWDLTPSMSSLDAVRTPLAGNFDATWREFVKANWNRGTIDDLRKWDGLKAQAFLKSTYSVKKGESPIKVGVNHLSAKYFTFVPDSQLTNVEISNEAAGEPGAGLQAIISYTDGTEKVEDWSEKSLIELCLKNPDVKEITLVFSNSNIDPSSKIVFDVIWKAQEAICCSGAAAPRRQGASEQLVSAAGTPCPTVTGTITYTETDSWEAPVDGCCAGSETLTVEYDVRMAPEPDGWGWVDAGSSYDVTWNSQQSGHGQFGMVECDYQDSYQGSGSGLLEIVAGKMVEEGDFSPVTGKQATGREVLLAVGDWDIGYTSSGTKTYSGCDNPSSNVTISDGPHERDLDLSIEGDCKTHEGYLWLRGAGNARTLTYTCTGTDEDGRTKKVTATVTF